MAAYTCLRVSHMEALRKNMDLAVRHWGAFRRQFPSRFKVTNVAFIHQKRERVSKAFDTCNFSLVLAGRGDYRRAGEVWSVRAPMVIVQLPGEALDYGPLPGETWDELYIVYDRALVGAWIDTGLLDPRLPVWPMADFAAVESHSVELGGLLRSSAPEHEADRLDRVCERLIFETRKDPTAVARDIPAVTRIAAQLKRDLRAPVNFDAVARRLGMSPSTFRRRWQEALGVAPARYLQQLRVQEACRLLVENTRPVRAIADAVGFEDEFYFSRRFRAETGLPPREYRRRYRLERP